MLQDIGMTKQFVNKTPNAQETKENIENEITSN